MKKIVKKNEINSKKCPKILNFKKFNKLPVKRNGNSDFCRFIAKFDD